MPKVGSRYVGSFSLNGNLEVAVVEDRLNSKCKKRKNAKILIFLLFL